MPEGILNERGKNVRISLDFTAGLIYIFYIERILFV